MVACRDRTPFRLLLLLTLLAISSDSAAAASLNLLPAPSALNASQNQHHEYYCNSLPSWTGGRPGFPTYQIDDCDQAIGMFEQDVARNPGGAQWLSLGFPHAVPGYGTPVWTPKRYTFGKLPDLSVGFGWTARVDRGAGSRYVRAGDRKPPGRWRCAVEAENLGRGHHGGHCDLAGGFRVCGYAFRGLSGSRVGIGVDGLR